MQAIYDDETHNHGKVLRFEVDSEFSSFTSSFETVDVLYNEIGKILSLKIFEEDIYQAQNNFDNPSFEYETFEC